MNDKLRQLLRIDNGFKIANSIGEQPYFNDSAEISKINPQISFF